MPGWETQSTNGGERSKFAIIEDDPLSVAPGEGTPGLLEHCIINTEERHASNNNGSHRLIADEVLVDQSLMSKSAAYWCPFAYPKSFHFAPYTQHDFLKSSLECAGHILTVLTDNYGPRVIMIR